MQSEKYFIFLLFYIQDNFKIFCFGSNLSLMYVYTNTLYLIEFPLLF